MHMHSPSHPQGAGAPQHGADTSSHGGRTEFFDRIAAGWDGRVATDSFLQRLADATSRLDVDFSRPVLDLGCGTGNLTRFLATSAPPSARILAADFSIGMLQVAQEKLAGDERVEWLHTDAASLPLPDGAVGTVMCFSAWPHFPAAAAVAAELRRVLQADGVLHILHVDGREAINRIHHHAGGAVAHDMLPPAAELAALLEEHGFTTLATVDEPDRYLVSARRS
jgi:ubiquinone/menaquinone biosynthesis C-methylase UbiE